MEERNKAKRAKTGPGEEKHALWGHLPLLLRSGSKDSVEYVLQALWRTRNTGLDAADRAIIANILHLNSHADLDPLLVCLRMLMRKCVRGSFGKDDIQKLFPSDVSLELQRLLALLLQKFLPEWREDFNKEQLLLPHFETMTWDIVDQVAEGANKGVLVNLKLQSDGQFSSQEKDVRFQLEKDKLEMMMKSLYALREQLSSAD